MFITGSVRNYALRWPETRSSRAAKNHTSTTTSTSTTTPVNSTTSHPVPLPASRRRTSRLPRQGPPTHPQNPHAAAPLTPHAAVSLTRSRRNSITLSVQIGDGTLSFHPPSPLLFSLPLSSTFPHFSLTIKISSLGREGPIGHIAAKGYGERLFLRSPLATVFFVALQTENYAYGNSVKKSIVFDALYSASDLSWKCRWTLQNTMAYRPYQNDVPPRSGPSGSVEPLTVLTFTYQYFRYDYRSNLTWP